MSSENKNSQTRLFKETDERLKRSKFPMGFGNKMTANFNKFVPSLNIDLMPGDKVNLNTSFFSRWLTMSAPVFSEYKIRVNNFFIPNQSVWGGFAQFMGQGDSASSLWLLDGNPYQTADSNLKVPYFTTSDFVKSVAQIAVKKKNITSSFSLPITSLPNFKVVLAPVLSYTKRSYRDAYDTSSESGGRPRPDGYETAWNSLLSSSESDHVWLIPAGAVALSFFFVAESPELDNYIKNGYVLDTSSVASTAEFNRFIDSVKNNKFVFYYDNYNLGAVKFSDGFGEFDTWTFIPFSHEFIPIDNSLLNVATGVAGSTSQFAPSNIKIGFSEIVTPSALFSSAATRYHAPALGFTLLDDSSTTWGWTLTYPAGYLFTLTEGDVSFRADRSSLTLFDIYKMTIGQTIVKKYFGAKTLSDYLGNTLTQQVKRQPLNVFDEISGNILSSRGVSRGVSLRPLGTYVEQGDLMEVGIVNDSPISLLPYLAYHKTWSDLFREPRYELRCVYSDPYRSPFLVPFNGTYHNGNMLQNTIETSSAWTAQGFVVTSPNYYEAVSMYYESISSYVGINNVFTYLSFIDLVSLRERRVVADYYTLLTPQPQDGRESAVEISSGFATGGAYVLDSRTDEAANGDLWVDGGALLAGTYNNLGASQDVHMISHFNISALRMANKIQKFLERNNVVGSDYVKQILTHFGAKPTEYPTTACWYLGGKLFTPNLSPVEMVGANSDTQSTGQQSAQMYSSGQVNAQNFTAKEHGILLQLFTIQNDFDSIQGLRPQKISKFDFPFPEFSDLGAEAVPLNELVHTDDTWTNGKTIFGYAPRYARSKCMLNEVHGDFKKSLAYWTTSRKFNPSLLFGTFGHGDPVNTPEIGRNFLYEDADYSAFTYTEDDYDHCLLDIKHYISVVRNLPTLPTPSIE